MEHGLMTLSVLVTRSAGPSVLVTPGDFLIYFWMVWIFLLPFSSFKYKICLSIALYNQERGCCYGKPC